jgi:hypothetical protein
LTFEGVKSDALFSFQPPFNIPAMMILIPLKPFLTPRKFHTVVVFLCRMFGCPVLLTISFFERYVVGPFDKDRNSVGNSLKLTVANSLGGLALNHFNSIMKGNSAAGTTGRRRTTMSKMSSRISRNLRKFGGLAVINACFDYEPYPPVQNDADAQEAEDQLTLVRDRKVSYERHSPLYQEPEELGHNDTVRKKKASSPVQSSSVGVQPSDLENGTLRKAKQASTTGQPSLDSKMKHAPTFGPLGPTAGRELTTLEKLFLPHAGMVSSFVGPVPTVPVVRTEEPSEPTAKPPESIEREEGSDSDSSSSTIDEERCSRPTTERPGPPRTSSTLSSRPTTMYLDPPRTSLGGNHKPASIIQDEFEEERLERRRHGRRRRTTTRLSAGGSSSDLDVLQIAARSSRHSLIDHSSLLDDHDTHETLNARRSNRNEDRLLLVSLSELEKLFQSHFHNLELKLASSLKNHLTNLPSHPPPPPTSSSSATSSSASSATPCPSDTHLTVTPPDPAPKLDYL